MRTLSMKRIWKTTISIFCLLLPVTTIAQIYPVQVTPQLIPPYSFKLSDYTTTTQEKLFVNLLLTDALESGRQVRLKMYVEGPGIKFQTLDFVPGMLPIILDGGVNQRLTNLDLQPYFDLNNLVGISPQQYARQLPEGQYRFCFEVYDQFSDQRISNRSCANIFLVLNDPPLLNVPFRGDLVTARDPQNLVFNWTPRHFNAGAVQYEFTLKELWDTGMDPQAAFMASLPLYQTTTFANTLHYGPAQMQLLEGKNYGWQVRAFVSDGITDTSLFRNNGLSEVYHFVYRADCHPPRFVLSEAQNSQTVKVSWQMGEQVRYRVQYRKKGHGEGDWFGLWSQRNEATLRNLEAGTVYEFRVGGDCNPVQSFPKGEEGGLAFSAIHEFTTPTEDEMAYYNCGIPPEIEIDNQEPLQQLQPYEVFTAGDFPVVVREASGSNGYFSGWGYITLPFLEQFKEVIDAANIATGGEVNIGKFSQIRVEFDDIKINTDYQMVQGMVETSYDPNWSGVVDVDQAIADIGQLLAELFSRKEELLTELSEAESFEEQQGIISQINDLEVTIGQQIDQIPNKENLPQELQDELESLKQEGGIVSSSELTSQEIEAISNADAKRRERISEIAAIAENSKETNSNSEEVAFEENEGYLFENIEGTNRVVYLSPAGIPVALSGEVPVKFYTVKNGITAYGALQSFTIRDGPNAGVYQAHKKGNEFTGYKINKDSAPYDFGALPDPNNIFVRTIDQGLGCSHLLLEGRYELTEVNTTGVGALVTDLGGTQWDLLPIEKQGYTTCLPPLDYDGFTEYVMGIYNPFGYGGFLRKVVAMDGSVAHVYSIADQENGWIIHYQYNRGNGKWEPIEVPEYNVDTAAALDYLFGQVFSSAAGHLVLDMVGMTPFAGEAFDFANGVWYTIEGDGASAAISFASTIPLVYATTVKNVGKVVKLANGTTVLVKFSEEATERLVDVLKRLDLGAAQLQKLSDDLVNKEFAEAIAENPELVEAWKVIKTSSDDDLAKLATNLDELDLVSKNLDDVTKFGGYKEWNRILRGTVKNGDELLYRLSKIDAPNPEIYKGDFYRTVGNGRDPLLTHYIPRGTPQRYSKPGEDALFFGSSKEGNFQELAHWDVKVEGNTTTFVYKEVQSTNLLDLTNPVVRDKIGISLDQITNNSYEFTDVIGTWARDKKYSGIIYPSARGTIDNKYFVNVAIFDSGTANQIIKGKTIEKILN